MQSRVHEIYLPLKFHVYTSNRLRYAPDKKVGQTGGNTQGQMASITRKGRVVTKCDLLPPPVF